jgi:hypothetical protein
MRKGSEFTTAASSKDAQTVLEPTKEKTAKKKRSHGKIMSSSLSTTTQRYQRSPMADGQM